jgi:ribosome-associated protein
MAIDEEHDDGFGGRSAHRRAISASWRWGDELVALPDWHLAAIPMPDELRAAVRGCRTLTSIPARNRQIRTIEGWLRDMDDDDRHVLRVGIDTVPEGLDPESTVKAWTDRLLADGDAAIDALIAEFPSADRQRMRTIARTGKVSSIQKAVRELVLAGS